MRKQTLWILAVLPGVVALTAPAQAQVAGFSDVPANHWAADSVQKLVTAGILQGPQAQKPAASAKFDGNKPVTRYELAAILYRFVRAIEKTDQQKRSKMGADLTGPDAVKYLVDNGYLSKDTPLNKEGAKLVTANQLSVSMAQVISRVRERSVPVSPGSKYSPD